MQPEEVIPPRAVHITRTIKCLCCAVPPRRRRRVPPPLGGPPHACTPGGRQAGPAQWRAPPAPPLWGGRQCRSGCHACWTLAPLIPGARPR
eukprot:9492711-Pyramimonas_sp.AAC.2